MKLWVSHSASPAVIVNLTCLGMQRTQEISRVRLLSSISRTSTSPGLQACNVYWCGCLAFAEKGGVSVAGERQQPSTSSVQHTRYPRRTGECPEYFSIFSVFYYCPYFLCLSHTANSTPTILSASFVWLVLCLTISSLGIRSHAIRRASPFGKQIFLDLS